MGLDLGLPGHVGLVAGRLESGELVVESGESDGRGEVGRIVGYRATCSCGWAGDRDHPPDEFGQMAANSEIIERHLKAYISLTPPAWLVTRSNAFRDEVAELTARWPLQAATLLAQVERWQRELTERAVAAARSEGKSWADIGTALGITKQSAHERFRAIAGERRINGYHSMPATPDQDGADEIS